MSDTPDLRTRMIEAALSAWYHLETSEPTVEDEQEQMDAALHAADAARAPMILAAVDELIDAASERAAAPHQYALYDPMVNDIERAYDDARRKLLALVGITESGA